MNTNYFLKGRSSFSDRLLSLDYILILLVLLLGIISFFAMYSTERGNYGYFTQSHIYRFTIFFVVFLLISFFKIQFWYKTAYPFYLIVLILLFAVDFFGVTASGSKRWINLFFINLQPSEIMKVSLIIFLARYYHKIPAANVTNIKYIVTPVFALFIPVALVVTQPDLGTALLIAIGGIAVIWLTGFSLKYFLYSFFMLVCLTPVVISFLKPYQKSRILTFFNPERDPLGAGYQIIQSKIAIGSGGFFGKGYLKGTQSYLEFLPEKHTDFIFTLFSEEFGFLGSIILMFLYILLISRVISIGFFVRSFFAKLYCFGFASAIFLYVFVNIAMVLGLLPIVGAPLPIMSYGGSSMLSIMLGLSIVMSCKIYSQVQITHY